MSVQREALMSFEPRGRVFISTWANGMWGGFQPGWYGKDTRKGQMSLLGKCFLPQAFNLRACFSYCRNSHRLQTGPNRIIQPVAVVQVHLLLHPSSDKSKLQGEGFSKTPTTKCQGNTPYSQRNILGNR